MNIDDFEYPLSDEDQSFDRPQPIIVEGFSLLPGEIVLLATPNVVNLSLISTNHRIGTMYLTNFQFFFIDDSTHQAVISIPNGTVSEIKKLKGHVTVKYQDQNKNTDTNNNNIDTSNTKNNENNKINESTVNNNNNPLAKSGRNPIPSSNNDPYWYADGISEKALILEIRCKDFNIARFCLPHHEKGLECFNTLHRLVFVDNPSSFFSQSYSPFKGGQNGYNGWTIYDPIEEYARQGLLSQGSEWRLSKINQKFELCQTYPQMLMIPFSISDYLLNKSALYRNKNRFPVCTWRHKYTHATLCRSSQPAPGISRSRCEEDELLVQAIRKSTPVSTSSTSTSPLYILDVRSKSSVGFSDTSKDISNYTNCVLEYGGLPSPQELRESAQKLNKTIRTWDDKKSWPDVQNSGWLSQISKLLATAKKILNYIHVEGCSVLVQCQDGWDRTSQLTCIVQLLADPYYRTIKGFIVLICKEWLSFGHKFMTRTGSLTSLPSKQTSPLFLQYIDSVWQLTRQFPTSFEFSDKFLQVLLHHLYSNLFGTFLYDSEKDRLTQKIPNETESLWTFLYGCASNGIYLNGLYVKPANLDEAPPASFYLTSPRVGSDLSSSGGTSTANIEPRERSNSFIVKKNCEDANVLFPNIQGVQLWTDYYLKWRTPMRASRKPLTLVEHALGTPLVNGDLLFIQKKRRSRRSSKRPSKSTSTDSVKDGSKSSKKHHHSHHHSSKSKRFSKEKESLDIKIPESNIDPIKEETIETKPGEMDKQNLEVEQEHISTSKVDEVDLKNIIEDERDILILSSNPSSSSRNNPLLNVLEPDLTMSNIPTIEEEPEPNENGDGEVFVKAEQSQEQENEHVQSPNTQEDSGEPLVTVPSLLNIQENNSRRGTLCTSNSSPCLTSPDGIDNNSHLTTTTTTTTTSHLNNGQNSPQESKEQRRLEKEKRKLEKEERRKERQERKEKKREKKEKEEKEHPKPDITVVLQNPSKAKPISLTMPARGSKNSRISIFSSTSSPQHTSTNNLHHHHHTNSPTNPLSPTLESETLHSADQPQLTESRDNLKKSRFFKSFSMRKAQPA
ncbi:hypothetical protein CYY_002732 [Polysphondylium violaceum]|uniref:Myotubularin phosphatase domain-containing protein n=1 Tax=Polysphondylium violaceum TaxID=133409 RepID=A0A8J4UUW0_9MYCE|nr:hypothetical protein CYY_002732 [Polysphondylium violaceum]